MAEEGRNFHELGFELVAGISAAETPRIAREIVQEYIENISHLELEPVNKFPERKDVCFEELNIVKLW